MLPHACRRSLHSIRTLVLGLGLLIALSAAHAAKWPPVDPAELADTKAVVDPEAGAEILLREVVIDHSAYQQFERRFRVRAKIYSERGLEKFSLIEIPYASTVHIRDINVRTIKPDGQIIELTKKDIFDREVLKVGKERTRMKSFAPAGLQPGAIVEYSYVQYSLDWEWYVPLFFQSDLPARRVRFSFRPVDATYLTFSDGGTLHANAVFFSCPNQALKPDRDGYYHFEMRNLTAVKDEPEQPPLLSTRASVMVCYSTGKSLASALYWPNKGKELHTRLGKETRPTKQIRATLATIVDPKDDEEQKLRKIYDFCRTKIRNRNSDGATFTSAELTALKTNDNATQTLERGYGTGEEINTLFVALALAAGSDARLALCNDRSYVQFNPHVTEDFMLYDLLAAVQLDGKWRYFEPGVTYLPFGMVSWRNQGAPVLISAQKDAALAMLPVEPPQASQRIRKAKLQLDADGTLEGEVTIDYSGLQEAELKWTLDGLATLERETFLRELLQAQLKLAELTNIKIENATNPIAPLTISYHLRVPEYADRTGSRLFFQPAVFQKNAGPLFPEEKRRTNVMFQHAHTLIDEIRILPPEGYELEEASAPGAIPMGELGGYDAKISVVKRTGELIYRRNFSLKGISFENKFYGPIRQAFETMHRYDGHTLTLRRKATPASSGALESTTPDSPPPERSHSTGT